MAAKEERGARRIRLERRPIAGREELLLLGAAGLVGSHLRAALRGRPVLATYHEVPVPDAVPLDITDAASVRRVILRARPAAVVLAAADAHVERCEREPTATRRVNVEAARAVVDAAHEVGATVVVFSSEYVFDGTAGPYREEEPPRPINEYGRQKVELEAIARTTPNHLICRTSSVFGWEDAGKNFVCQLLRRLRGGQPLEVPADQVVTPTYALELARAVVALLDARGRGTFHVVGPEVLPRPEFARLAAEAFGLPARLITPRRTADLGLLAPRPANAGLRADKLRAALGSPLLAPRAALVAMRASEARA